MRPRPVLPLSTVLFLLSCTPYYHVTQVPRRPDSFERLTAGAAQVGCQAAPFAPSGDLLISCPEGSIRVARDRQPTLIVHCSGRLASETECDRKLSQIVAAGTHGASAAPAPVPSGPPVPAAPPPGAPDRPLPPGTPPPAEPPG